MRPTPLLLALLLAGCGLGGRTSLPAAAPAGAMRAATKGSFTSGSHGGRAYKLYAPGGTGARPLVVMLHGCTQDPDDFARGTRMNQLAEREGFFVLYPAQTRDDHPMACMPWYDPAQQRRGQGLAAQIVGMIDKVADDHAIDRARVHVAGMSAGAAYAVALAAIYPDVFAAVGVHSGLEYGAATSELAARMAMAMGGPDPDKAGRAAYAAMGRHARVVPAIVLHGTADYVVVAKNGDQVARQFVQTADLARDGVENDDIDPTPDARTTAQAPGGRSYTRLAWHDPEGRSVVEQIVVDGMGHAWSGGDPAGSYTDGRGPDAARLFWDFFATRKLPTGGKRRGE